MTHEEKAKWIGRAFILFVAAVIIAIVFAPSRGKSGAKAKAKPNTPKATATATAEETGSKVTHFNAPGSLQDGQIPKILEEASKKRGSVVVGIIHCHVPGNPESEQIADSLNRVAKKYGNQVRVIRVDIVANPEFAKAEKVTQPPKVVMMAGAERACKFQGVWTQTQIEFKVEEILRGLKRVGKDWLPEVKGMTPASKSTAP